MTTAEPEPYPSKLFHYNPKRRVLSADARTLGWFFERLPDGIDPPPAVRVKSGMTGNVLEFAYVRTEYGMSKRATSWWYKNTEQMIRVQIFND